MVAVLTGFRILLSVVIKRVSTVKREVSSQFFLWFQSIPIKLVTSRKNRSEWEESNKKQRYLPSEAKVYISCDSDKSGLSSIEFFEAIFAR